MASIVTFDLADRLCHDRDHVRRLGDLHSPQCRTEVSAHKQPTIPTVSAIASVAISWQCLNAPAEKAISRSTRPLQVPCAIGHTPVRYSVARTFGAALPNKAVAFASFFDQLLQPG